MVDADSVREILEKECTTPSMLGWLKTNKVTVMILRRFRDWKSHNEANAPVKLDP